MAHLLNARLYDCYAEGLGTVFAEQAVAVGGRDWDGWRQYLGSNAEPFYSATYFLMRDVVEAVGEAPMRRFLSHAVYSNVEKTRMRIDINGWLATLTPGERARATRAIKKHAAAVRAVKGTEFAFDEPA